VFMTKERGGGEKLWSPGIATSTPDVSTPNLQGMGLRSVE
jgi:hypothetical protein